MRSIRLVIACGVLFATPAQNLWAEQIPGYSYIDDTNLRACVERHKPPIKQLKCHSAGIKSLVGLERVSQLASLSLFNNHIREIDLTHWPDLEELNISKNPLTDLDISHARLKKVFAFSATLQRATINAPALQELKLNNNQLQSLILTDTQSLTKLDSYNNQLKSLAISQLTNCKLLDVRNNPMPDSLYDEMDKMPCLVMHDGNAEDWR